MRDKKIIITDVDGVLLSWDTAFDDWLFAEHGISPTQGGMSYYCLVERYGIDRIHSLMTQFNESDNIGVLEPLRDSIEYVQLLHKEHGYVFNCVTSFGTNENSLKLRDANLRSLFGEDAIGSIDCLPAGACKRDILSHYSGTGLFFIEDRPENAVVGHELGLNSILMRHGYNSDFNHPDIPVVDSWKEIYSIIVPQ